MKTKHYIMLVLGGLTAFIAGFIIGKDRMENPCGAVTETIETRTDTMGYYAPMPQSELASGTQLYTLPGYRFAAGGNRGEARQRGDNGSISENTLITAHYGTGAGGKPRCCDDSAIVELPIIQRHYADSTYEAWVSGPVDPRLDSLRVFAPTTIITRREWKPPKRWHLGVTAGCGVTPRGIQPYIGIGITYSVISF